MQGIPPVKSTDAEDVVWGLQTADALWKRGERIDALVWLRRAAQAAGDAADDDRALELARHAAELTDWVANESDAPRAPYDTSADTAPPHSDVPGREVPTFVPGAMESSPLPVDVDLGETEASLGRTATTTERPMPPRHDAASQPTMQTAEPAFAEVPAAPAVDDEARMSVLPAEKVHAGMFNPWDDGAPIPAPVVRNAPSPLPNFVPEEEEVITSVRPLPVPPEETAPSPAVPQARPHAPMPPAKPPAKPPPLPPRARTQKPPVPPRPPAPVHAREAPATAEADVDHALEPATDTEPPPPSKPTATTQHLAPETAVEDAPSPSPLAASAEPPLAAPEPPSAAAEAEERPSPIAEAPPPLSLSVSEPLSLSEPPPVVPSFPAGAPEIVAAGRSADALDLSAVEAFADLPDEARAAFAAAAKIDRLAEGEEVSHFALAYVLEGAFDVAATMVDAPALRLQTGAVLRARGTTQEGVPMRLISVAAEGRVATWSADDVDAAFRTIPWVEEDLRAAADRAMTLVGITIGPLGERLDVAIREAIVSKLTMRPLAPGEVVVKAGDAVPGLFLVGVGELELVKDGDVIAGAVGSGDFLFATEVLGAGPAPATARAGAGGALILYGDLGVAQELLVTCPPLLEVFAGM